MTTLNLLDALEICLQSLERGADVETCLAPFPKFADELRPILWAASQARSAAAENTIPAEVVNRGREKVLLAAAAMRENKNTVLPVAGPVKARNWFGARFARLAVTAAVVVGFLLTGGTGLVNASSAALPGDHLYPVKRSWENVRLVFVFDQQTKQQLTHEFEHERVQEIEELYTEKRIAEVNFQGEVGAQTTNTWVVGGLSVRIDKETLITGDIQPGSMVLVTGETEDGRVVARSVSLVGVQGATPTSSPFPSFNEDPTSTNEAHNGGDENGGGMGGDGNATPTYLPGATSTSDDSSWFEASATPRPGGGDDGSGEHGTPGATPTPEHQGGDGEHHGTRTPEATETHHDGTRTPEPTESGH